MRKELAQGARIRAMWTGVMIRQYNTLSTSTEQVLGYSEKGKCLRFVGFAVVLFTFAVGAYSAEEDTHVHDHEGAVAALEHAQTTNVTCPVMTDMKVDTDIFTDHEGKRIYFCCRNCRAAFGKNPKKYLSRLPQIGGTPTQTGREHKDRGPELTLAGFIKPMGVTTLSLLVLTVAAALLRRRKPTFLLKWHKLLGITTLVSAAIHATLVLIAH